MYSRAAVPSVRAAILSVSTPIAHACLRPELRAEVERDHRLLSHLRGQDLQRLLGQAPEFVARANVVLGEADAERLDRLHGDRHRLVPVKRERGLELGGLLGLPAVEEE